MTGNAVGLFTYLHHKKHMSNTLHVDIMMTMMLLGNKKFSALLQSYGATVIGVVHHWLNHHYVVHDCIANSRATIKKSFKSKYNWHDKKREKIKS